MRAFESLSIHALFASAVLCIMISTLRAAQITANTIRTDTDTDGTWLAVWGMAECAVAVVIGLTPAFAVLVRAGRNAIRKADQEGQEMPLNTIGGSGGSGNSAKKIPTETWLAMNDSQEMLATKEDEASITTSAHHDEESLRLAR